MALTPRSTRQFDNAPDSDTNSNINEIHDIYSNHSRYLTLSKVLNPLIEGIALFAELDTYPTQSEVCPSFLIYCSIVFSGKSHSDLSSLNSKEIDKEYSEFLVERRLLAGEGILKKARLLSTSIDIFINPYLTGYLFVKSMQRLLIAVSKKFCDPNFFLVFIKQYFFEDLAMIEHILSPEVQDESIFPQVTLHFQKKIKNILSLSADEIHDFEEKNSQSHQGRNIENGNHSKILEKYPKLRDLVKNHDKACEDAVFYGMGTMRSYFRCTQLPCYVEITKTRVTVFLKLPISELSTERYKELADVEMSFSDDTYLFFPGRLIANKEHHDSFCGDAIMESYVSFRDLSEQFTVFEFGENKQIFIFSGQNYTKEKKIVITQYFKKSRGIINNIDFNSVIKDVWEKVQVLKDIERHNEVYNLPMLNKIYHMKSFCCSESAFANIEKLLMSDGFFDILKQQRLVELLAYISLYSSNKCASLDALLDENICRGFTEMDIRNLETLLKDVGFSVLHLRGRYVCTQAV